MVINFNTLKTNLFDSNTQTKDPLVPMSEKQSTTITNIGKRTFNEFASPEGIEIKCSNRLAPKPFKKELLRSLLKTKPPNKAINECLTADFLGPVLDDLEKRKVTLVNDDGSKRLYNRKNLRNICEHLFENKPELKELVEELELDESIIDEKSTSLDSESNNSNEITNKFSGNNNLIVSVKSYNNLIEKEIFAVIIEQEECKHYLKSKSEVVNFLSSEFLDKIIKILLGKQKRFLNNHGENVDYDIDSLRRLLKKRFDHGDFNELAKKIRTEEPDSIPVSSLQKTQLTREQFKKKIAEILSQKNEYIKFLENKHVVTQGFITRDFSSTICNTLKTQGIELVEKSEKQIFYDVNTVLRILKAICKEAKE